MTTTTPPTPPPRPLRRPHRPEDTTETTADEDPESASPAAFCDAYVATTIMMNSEPDPAALTENVELIDANAPAEIADSAAVMTAAVRKVLESGGQDFSPFETPEYSAAQAEVDPFVFENCEFDAAIEVTGLDFSFDGLPDTMEGGRTAILFTNEGAESHEIAIMRRNDGVTESFEDLLALPEEEAMAKVTPVSGAFAPSTGSQALLVGDFEPGDYIAICFVPVGTTLNDEGMTEGTGEPHFMHGMQQEFTVS
ncbi:MAG: hypothetical protein GX643_01740 [Acidimicrobiales bacterium]|nr:hypothetical protein [Acidimicrobiales bacterium]